MLDQRLPLFIKLSALFDPLGIVLDVVGKLGALYNFTVSFGRGTLAAYREFLTGLGLVLFKSIVAGFVSGAIAV
jgi:hypothetical protein|tara:strand:- start:3124 stop:3345 length:222 start_codon:yes stop_codon:yes gene_type:complete